jgi:hypothetical protein
MEIVGITDLRLISKEGDWATITWDFRYLNRRRIEMTGKARVLIFEDNVPVAHIEKTRGLNRPPDGLKVIGTVKDRPFEIYLHGYQFDPVP